MPLSRDCRETTRTYIHTQPRGNGNHSDKGAKQGKPDGLADHQKHDLRKMSNVPVLATFRRRCVACLQSLHVTRTRVPSSQNEPWAHAPRATRNALNHVSHLPGPRWGVGNRPPRIGSPCPGFRCLKRGRWRPFLFHRPRLQTGVYSVTSMYCTYL
jgi:hypothetical protein